MGVYIKGMKMPESCILCRLECLYRIHSSSARSEYCPLIEIAEPKNELRTEVKIEPSWAGETYGHFKDEPQTELKGSKRLVKGSDHCDGCIYNIYENVLACVACVLKDKGINSGYAESKDETQLVKESTEVVKGLAKDEP